MSYVRATDPFPLETADHNKLHEFYARLASGRLSTTRCTACHRTAWPPRGFCGECASDAFEWVDLPAEGTIHAFTVQDTGLPAGFDGPRVFAIVKVDGHRIFAVVRDAHPASLAIGQRVRLAPLRVADDPNGHPRYLPAFSAIERDDGATTISNRPPALQAGLAPPAPMKVLVAKPGLDGHDRGAKVVVQALRDAGMEVVYSGLKRTPDEIVAEAIQEDVDVVGLSILSGAHLTLARRVVDGLRARGAADVRVVVGGIVPPRDIEPLLALGVERVFPMGTPLPEIVRAFKESG